MPNMRQLVIQEFNEKRFSRKFIDGYIREAIQTNPDIQAKVVQGAALVQNYLEKSYFPSKNARIDQLQGLDVTRLVEDIFIGIAYFQKEELFTSVTAQLAGRLKFSDKTEAIATVAELVAVLCATDAFDICKADKQASLMLISRIPLDEKVLRFIAGSSYLPPMVCEPLELENNYSSGYLSHSDSLILGNGNHHDGDICLDVLNLVNSVAMKLDIDFLKTVQEEPTFELDTAEKIHQWTDFKKQSTELYVLMAEQGNKFWFTNKVDKRGRIYAQGYHITTQGTAFKKASIELAHEELIEGVLC